MKRIEINTTSFFELLKIRDTSMWEIFAQMIDGEEKEILFLDDDAQVLFSYVLPESPEKLEEDRQKFAKEYAEKLASYN